MKITAKEAKETTVFVLNYKAEIEETNLFDHVMLSNDETSSPRGIEPMKFYEEVAGYFRDKQTGKDVDPEDEDVKGNDIEEYSLFIVYKWYFGKKQEVARFESEEEAEQYLFEWVYDYDFQEDDQRSTHWFDTFEEAEEELAEIQGIDVEVYRSIDRKRKIIEGVRAEKQAEERKEKEKRLNALAKIYAENVPTIKGESKQETQTRVSKNLGRIEKDVFWRVVQIVRSR